MCIRETPGLSGIVSMSDIDLICLKQSLTIFDSKISGVQNLFILVVFIRFQFSAHGGQLYKRILLEFSLKLII